jgi:hypothetical protein
MNTGKEDEGEAEARLSLWRLEKLMNGDLPPAEAEALRESLSGSKEAAAYLAKYAALRSDLRRKEGRAPNIREAWPAWARNVFPSRGHKRHHGTYRGFAWAALLAMGAGLVTWSLRQPPSRVSPASGLEDSSYQLKGPEAIRVRLQIGAVACNPGEVASAKPGDTLGITYRSPRPVLAGVWFLEEGGKPQAMTGPAGKKAWPIAMGWGPAPIRILLEGEWQRQTVWVLSSFSAFTTAEALQALQGGPHREDLWVDTFRLTR